MMKSTIVIAAAITIAASAVWAQAVGDFYPAYQGWCHPDTVFQNLAQENVVREVTASGSGDQEWRDYMNLPVVPASEITVVQVDSLCMKAGKLINVALGRPVSEQRAVFLIQVGSRRYWVEDPDLHYGGHPYRFIVDSTMSTVLSRTM